MSSFPANGAMEAICFFRSMEWKRIPVRTSCGMAFFFAGVSARHMSLRRLEPRWTVFKKRMMRAAGVHLTWSGEWGWEISLAHRRTRPPVLGSHEASGGAGPPSGCVWDCPPCALRARQGCEDQSMTGICRRSCEAEAELVDASILVSNVRQVRLLPIGVRGRQHDESHIGQSCSERHRFSVLRVASIDYGH